MKNAQPAASLKRLLRMALELVLVRDDASAGELLDLVLPVRLPIGNVGRLADPQWPARVNESRGDILEVS